MAPAATPALACDKGGLRIIFYSMASGHGRRCGVAEIARRIALGVWSFALIGRSLVRALMTSVALAAGVLLAGCNGDEISLANNAKANQPVPPKLIAKMEAQDMDLQSPILVRLFKQEAELEVWKQDRSGRFALLKTYPICRWSGDLGPKVREGDRKAPEGFYSLTPARESFLGGQKSFQLQAYPFRMTPLNMAKHRNNPNMPFWRMIKEGYDHFEVTRQEPKVDFCEKKHLFEAVNRRNAKREPVFDASAKCPVYLVPDEVAEAVRERQEADQTEIAKLVARGTPAARVGSGIDGGMHKVFAAKLPGGNTGLSEGGQGLALLTLEKAPGTIPPHVNIPRGPVTSPDDPFAASLATSASPEPATRVASAAPTAQVQITSSQNTQSEGFFSSLARKVGLGGSADTTATASQSATAKPKAAEARLPRPEPAMSKASAPKADPKQAAAPRPPLKPAVTDTAAAAPTPGPASAFPAPSLVAGAQPIVSANSFESRFSAAK